MWPIFWRPLRKSLRSADAQDGSLLRLSRLADDQRQTRRRRYGPAAF